MLDAIISFVLEAMLVGLFYWPGWLVLRLMTLGRYPRCAPSPHNEYFVATFGAATLLMAVTALLV